MKTRRTETQSHVSVWAVRLFAAYSRGYLRKRFHALRILRSNLPPRNLDTSLVVFLNHASWWDPLVCLLLAREFFASRDSFAPIEAGMLRRYQFFRHLGFFPVEQKTCRGALTFFRRAHEILAAPNHALWLTPQGRFTDVRERPPRLQDGLGALAAREPDAAFIPLAIEYSFWTEPRPEVLCAFGNIIVPRNEPKSTPGAWKQLFSDGLERLQDDLAARSCQREPADWLTLNRGRSSVSSVYDLWRGARARLRGDRFTSEHQPEAAR